MRRWSTARHGGDEARDFHIVFLRNNLLTYFRKEIIEAALPAIADSLVPGGILVVGRKERLPGFLEGFRAHEAMPCLHRRQNADIFS